ncbi:MAG: hypothetical protein Q4B43_10280 [Bacteroidota bacterium]|nr:hypothetical protein [Bacteroidota bacterium]
MEDYIFNKNYFGRDYNFCQVDINKPFDNQNFKNKGADSIIALINNADNRCDDIKNITQYTDLRGLSIEGIFDSLDGLSEFKKLEFLNMNVKCKKEIPFGSLKNLWCIYLNYNKKTDFSVFDCQNLEYIFIDNYKESDACPFEKFSKAKRIGLMQTHILSFPLEKMPHLEHFGMGYNAKIQDISWLNHHSLQSLSIANCKHIKNWNTISTLKQLEILIIENCKEIPSLDFLLELNQLKEIRLIGDIKITDNKIAKILELPNLKKFVIPIRKEYDLTFQEYTQWKNRW